MIGFITRSACPVCASEKVEKQVDEPLKSAAIVNHLMRYYGGTVPVEALHDGRYTLMYCQNCGSHYQREVLNDEGMEQLYESWIQVDGSFQKKAHAMLSVRVGYARQCTQIARAFRLPPHQIRVLDFGMGWGTWLQMARAFGMDSDGLELSPSRIAHAQTIGLRVVRPEDIPPRAYHFINAEQVFEHLADPVGALQSCGMWLQTGGILRIAVPDGRQIRRQLKRNQWTVEAMPTIPLEHVNVFTPHSLRMFAEQAGFTVMHPPLVLPATSLHRHDLRQFLGVLAADIAGRLGVYKTTVVWLRKTG